MLSFPARGLEGGNGCTWDSSWSIFSWAKHHFSPLAHKGKYMEQDLQEKNIYIKIVLCGKKLNCFRYANFQKETGVTANYSMFLLNLSASKNLRCLTHFIYLSGKKFENNIIVSMINEKAKYCWVVEDTGCYYGLLLLWIEPPRHQLTSHCYDYLLQYLFH